MENRKRLCFLLGNYYEQVRGGAEYQAYLLAEQLNKLGYDVHYIYLDNDKKFEKTLDIALHPVKKSNTVSRKWQRIVVDGVRIIRVLKKINPDVVYQRTGSAYTGAAAYYARRNHKKFIWHVALDLDVTPLSVSYSNYLSARTVEKRMLEWGMKNADVVIAQAMYQAEMLRVNYGIENAMVIPNYHPAPSACIEKKEWPINVIWIANIKPSKQPLLYLDLADAFKTEKNINFYMVGRMGQSLARAVYDRMNEVKNVVYLSELSQAEVNALLERSHVLVNTSAHEGFPNTFIQAWMRKVPVISLKADPDGVLEKEGIGYRSGSIDRMIQDCRMLIENRQMRNQMGEKAYRYAINNHSIDNIRKIVDIIEDGYRPEGEGGTVKIQSREWNSHYSM